MNVIEAIEIIKQRFPDSGQSVSIPLQRGGQFKAERVEDGILVDNLANLPLLPWVIFQEVVCLLIRQGGRAKRGDAMNSRLGETGLPLDSVEGHIAQVVYGKSLGQSVFRRISPIAAILVWAGICEAGRGELKLRE